MITISVLHSREISSKSDACTWGLMRARVASTAAGATSMTSALAGLRLREPWLSGAVSIALLRSDGRLCQHSIDIEVRSIGAASACASKALVRWI
jgi:hypothetical protein